MVRAAVRDWADSFVALWRGTAGVWRVAAPRLVAILTVSWTASRVLQLSASAMGIMIRSQEVDIGAETLNVGVRTVATWNQWVAILLVSISLLALLVGLIMALRALGDCLSARAGVRVADDSRPSLYRVLSVTLLAFLGIYSVFDQVGAIINRVISDALMLNRDPLVTLFAPLMPATWQDASLVVGVIAAAFLLRRVAEQRADSTGNRGMGVLAAVLESFYLFAFFIVGRGLILEARHWLVYRHLALWTQDATDWLGLPLRWLKVSLPDLATAAWAWFWDVGWPVVLSSMLQPLLWLALASLVLGSGIKTFGELLEAGHLRAAVARRTRGARVATRVTDVLERHGTAARHVQDAVLSNVDDKYLPILHSLRSTLRGGVGFLGAFVVAFALLGLAETWAAYGLDVLVGPRDFSTEQFLDNFKRLVVYVVFMSARLALLAAAFAQVAAHTSAKTAVTA